MQCAKVNILCKATLMNILIIASITFNNAINGMIYIRPGQVDSQFIVRDI